MSCKNDITCTYVIVSEKKYLNTYDVLITSLDIKNVSGKNVLPKRDENKTNL